MTRFDKTIITSINNEEDYSVLIKEVKMRRAAQMVK